MSEKTNKRIERVEDTTAKIIEIVNGMNNLLFQLSATFDILLDKGILTEEEIYAKIQGYKAQSGEKNTR